jgi:hypothetical protein
MMPRFLGPRVGTSRQTVPLQVLRTDVPLATVVEERHRTARLRLRKSPALQLAGTRPPDLQLRVSCCACVSCHVVRCLACPHLLRSQTQWATWA